MIFSSSAFVIVIGLAIALAAIGAIALSTLFIHDYMKGTLW